MPDLTATTTPTTVPSVRGSAVVIVNNETSTVVYYGRTVTVDSTNGIPIVAGGNLVLDGGNRGPHYVVTSTGTADVRWEYV